MATLTYDPTPADQPEFNQAEQEALAIGERQAEAEQQMYAGKFKDAEALEQAYIELQKKLGDQNGDEEGLQSQQGDEEESDEEEVDFSPVMGLLTEASDEFYSNDGELTPETLEKLEALDSGELIAAYIALQGTQGQAQPAEDLAPTQVTDIQNSVGGEEAYTNIINWASENMPQNFVESFNNIVNVGDPDMIKLAVAGVKSAYENANGYEGNMLSGRSSADKADVFRSQAEVVQAMADPRYDRDPAYRQDVFNKLDRSNLQY